jgi:predicted Zn-dependent peptidase
VFGRGSEAFRGLYESGLTDESFFAYGAIYPDIGVAAIGGDSPRPQELVETLRKTAEKAEEAIREEDFVRAKRKFTGEFVRRFNTVELLGTHSVAYYLSDVSLGEVWEAVGRVTIEDVRQRARDLFHAERSAVAAVLPLAWEGEVR